MTDRKEQEIILKIKEGLNYEELKQYFGYSSDCQLLKIARRNNLKIAKKPYVRHKPYKGEEEILRLRKLGFDYTDIANKLGRDRDSVKRVCGHFGVSETKEEAEKRKRERNRRSAIAQFSIDWKERAENVYKDYTLVSVSDVYGNNHDRSIILECKRCGARKTVSSITLRKKRSSNYLGECLFCKKERKDKEKEAKRLERKEERAERKKVKLIKRKVQVSFAFCSCGSLLLPNRKVCDDCKRRATRENERRKDYKRRALKEREQDKDITLKKLFDNAGGICYICGQRCDYDDYMINENGAFVVGATYPTIEHVVPLSRGGSHTWQNVKLACHGCNSRKGTKLFEEIMPPYKKAN